MDFDPQVGHEIMKWRPALVLTPKKYNISCPFCVVCPISTKPRGYLFEVPVVVKGRHGVVKSDQVKSVDWRGRKAKFIAHAPASTLMETRMKIAALLFEEE